MIDYMGDDAADLGISRLQEETDDAIEVKKEYETLEEFQADFVDEEGRAVYLDEENVDSVKPGVVQPYIILGTQGATVYTIEVSFPKSAFPGNIAINVSPHKVCTTAPPSAPP